MVCLLSVATAIGRHSCTATPRPPATSHLTEVSSLDGGSLGECLFLFCSRGCLGTLHKAGPELRRC